MPWRSIVIATCLLLAGGVARTQTTSYTAGELLKDYKYSLGERTRVPRPFETGFCIGLVAGASYVDPKSCAPENAPIGELMRVVLEYIEVRPQRLHEPFMNLVQEALRNKWPC
jgi:hypothetical protein